MPRVGYLIARVSGTLRLYGKARCFAKGAAAP